jgi:DNA polymerase
MDAATDIVAEQRAALAAIAKRIATCTGCGLCRDRNRTVPGEGAADAKIMFIGEGPGFYEDQQGRPFVGAAGKFLDELLAGIGLDRKKVFIANVVKCRPPNNRDPQPDEIAACSPHLDAQIAAIQPKVIVTLGRHSLQRYFPGESISRIHGTPRRKGDLIVVPMYHPAAALHQGSLRRVIEADFARLPGFLEKILAGQTPDASGGASAPLSAASGSGASTREAVAPPNAASAPVPAHLRKGAPNEPAAAPAASESQPEPQQMRLL